jgi:hypothetical protein
LSGQLAYFIKTRGIQPVEALRLVSAKRELQVMPGLDSMLWMLLETSGKAKGLKS